MRLIDLEARFLQFRGTDQDDYGWRTVTDISVATGVMFLCPKCFAHNKGPINTHSVVCHRFGHVPDWAAPKPGRWVFEGTGLADLTLNAPPGFTRSIQLTGGGTCGGGSAWHGFVTNGQASTV
jgi:hypothetical protein